MRKRLFQFAVLRHPTEAESREGKGEAVVVIPPSEFVLAENEIEITMFAIKAIPDEYMKEPGRLEVAVRPF